MFCTTLERYLADSSVFHEYHRNHIVPLTRTINIEETK